MKRTKTLCAPWLEREHVRQARVHVHTLADMRNIIVLYLPSIDFTSNHEDFTMFQCHKHYWPSNLPARPALIDSSKSSFGSPSFSFQRP